MPRNLHAPKIHPSGCICPACRLRHPAKPPLTPRAHFWRCLPVATVMLWGFPLWWAGQVIARALSPFLPN